MAEVIVKGPATLSFSTETTTVSQAAPVASSPPTKTVTASASGENIERLLAPGIFSPVPTFFLPQTEELDLPSLQKHVVRLASAGVGSVVVGSNGEAVHLTTAEKLAAVEAARKALDAAGFPDQPVVAGASAASTIETIQLCAAVARAGADYALILTHSFYSAAFRAAPETIVQYYIDVASASPIPILAYSYPAVSGINVTSDQLLAMAAHPNIVGAKLTCADVGKLIRVASVTAQPAFTASGRHGFFLYGGYSDFLLPGLFAHSSGAITGLANLVPRVVRKLFDLGVQAITTCDANLLKEAQVLQGIVSKADAALASGGIAATKYMLNAHFGYGGVPRRPLQPFAESGAISKLEAALKPILAMEIALS